MIEFLIDYIRQRGFNVHRVPGVFVISKGQQRRYWNISSAALSQAHKEILIAEADLYLAQFAGNPIESRANTADQKHEVIERLYNAWLRYPHLRLGQFLAIVTSRDGADSRDLFYIEDFDLTDRAVTFFAEIKELQ